MHLDKVQPRLYSSGTISLEARSDGHHLAGNRLNQTDEALVQCDLVRILMEWSGNISLLNWARLG